MPRKSPSSAIFDWADYFHFVERGNDKNSPVTLSAPDQNLRFTKEAARLGIHPVRYHHSVKNRFPLHTHTFFEIVLILSGRGNNVVEKRHFPIQAGDIVFVDNRRRHALASGPGGMDIVNLCFLPSSLGLDDALLTHLGLLDLYDFLRPFKNGDPDSALVKLRPPAAFFSRLSFYAHHMIELFAENDDRNAESLRHLMRLFLFLLLREYRKSKGPETGVQGAMLEAAQWIQGHSSEKITLEKLSGRLGMSRTYFSSTFNKAFGKKLTDFVNEVRVQKARELLASSELPILQVALETGFENKSHFHRVFMKLTGKTPIAWKSERKGSSQKSL